MGGVRFHKQLYRHRPKEGVWGDCWRTAIGCLLGLAPSDVPHFNRGGADGTPLPEGKATAETIKWLRDRGLRLVDIPFPGELDLDTLLIHAAAYFGDLPYLVSGTSRTGVNHVVIAQEKRILWDPSRTGAGLVGPQDDGFWWLGMIVRPPEGWR